MLENENYDIENELEGVMKFVNNLPASNKSIKSCPIPIYVTVCFYVERYTC